MPCRVREEEAAHTGVCVCVCDAFAVVARTVLRWTKHERVRCASTISAGKKKRGRTKMRYSHKQFTAVSIITIIFPTAASPSVPLSRGVRCRSKAEREPRVLTLCRAIGSTFVLVRQEIPLWRSWMGGKPFASERGMFLGGPNHRAWRIPEEVWKLRNIDNSKPALLPFLRQQWQRSPEQLSPMMLTTIRSAARKSNSCWSWAAKHTDKRAAKRRPCHPGNRNKGIQHSMRCSSCMYCACMRAWRCLAGRRNHETSPGLDGVWCRRVLSCNIYPESRSSGGIYYQSSTPGIEVNG